MEAVGSIGDDEQVMYGEVRLQTLTRSAFLYTLSEAARVGVSQAASKAWIARTRALVEELNWDETVQASHSLACMGADETILCDMLGGLIEKPATSWEAIAGPAVGLLFLLEMADTDLPPLWTPEILRALASVPPRKEAEVLEWTGVEAQSDQPKQDVSQRRALRSLIRILSNQQLQNFEALLAGFNVLNQVWDEGSACVRALLLKQGRLYELFGRALHIGVCREQPQVINDVRSQLYFSALRFVNIARGHELSVPELAPLCLIACGLLPDYTSVSSTSFHVLDFGCGPGTWAVPMAQALGEGCLITCVDADRTAVDVARHWASQIGISERVAPVHIAPNFADLDKFLMAKQFNVLFICDICRYLAHATKGLWASPHEAFYRANLGYWRRIRTHLTGSPTGVHVVSLEKPNLAEALRSVLGQVGFREVTAEHAHFVPDLNKFSMWPPHVIRLWIRCDDSDLSIPDSRCPADGPMPWLEIPPGVRALTPDYCLP